MKLLIIIMCMAISNVFATEIFKCADADGKQSFSDTPCAAGLTQKKLVYENSSWIKEIEARKPANTNILTIKKNGVATEFEYQFSKIKELKQFMRLAGKISGQNVYLLKIKKPTNAARGFALIKVTSKSSNLFGRKKT